MTIMGIAPTRFSTPVVERLRGTLLDAATVSEGMHVEPQALFETYNCLNMSAFPAWPCPPNLLAAPTQAASSTATTGGTLAAGTYRAVITALNDRGETVKSNEISQVTTGSTSTVTFNWNNLSGETGYRVYITNGASGSQALYVQVAADTTSYVMTAYPPAGNVAGTPPTVNSATITVTKSFETASWQDGMRFAVFGGVVCKTFEGIDEALVRKSFENRESYGVEKAFLQTRLVDSATLNWDAPVDLTPAGGAVKPEVGLAILEGHAATKYAGRPTIHAPRSIGSLLVSRTAAKYDGTELVSGLGSKIAAGGGYDDPNSGPTGAAPAAGEKWMYATGEVVLQRGELLIQSSLNTTTNETFVLAERTYMGAVDCYTSAVRVKVE